MKILIIYNLPKAKDRGTIYEHLYSFRNYSGEQCYYLNTPWGIPGFINKIHFDLVIYHYSFLSFTLRWPEADKIEKFKNYEPFKTLSGYKIAITQDEYIYSDILNEFFSSFGIKSVFTLYPPREWQKLFPRERSGLEHYINVFAGYLDEETTKRVSRWYQDHNKRPIDVGYRARKLPYWIGRHSLMKWQLTNVFLNAPIQHKLKLDLSNSDRDVFYGDDWYKFLGKCRVVLGCQSGSSLHDPDGSIMKKAEQYVQKHPDASFDEVETVCFPGLDGNMFGLPVSPRIFEACMMRTCLALVEGEYGGIIKPGVHYIEIKKDWSNLAEVFRQIEDVALCELIADNAYRDVIESGLYTYRQFVDMVLNHVRSVYPITDARSVYPITAIKDWGDSFYLKLLLLLRIININLSPFTLGLIGAKALFLKVTYYLLSTTKNIILRLGYRILLRTGLYPVYQRFISERRKDLH